MPALHNHCKIRYMSKFLEVYSESIQTYKMELFAKLVKDFVCQSPKYPFPVDTRRHFNVYKTYIRSQRRRMDVL